MYYNIIDHDKFKTILDFFFKKNLFVCVGSRGISNSAFYLGQNLFTVV